jgi:YVTN family beta-propeller protein
MEDMGKVLVYDATTFALKNTINVGKMPLEVSFSSDGMMAFVCNSMDNTLTAINAMDKTVMATIPVGLDPVGAWQG